MSSTNRGAIRQEFDYYATKPKDIIPFLRAFAADEPTAVIQTVLDPCAGGNVEPVKWLYKEETARKPAEIIDVPVTPMAYPQALRETFDGLDITTNDIRMDSPAQYHVDALSLPQETRVPYDLVITNPPFSIALEVIKAGLEMVRDGGYVAMLLRLNFLEGGNRFEFFRTNAPKRIYVHHYRLSFLPTRKTDSNAYAHMVWQKGYATDHSILRVI